jgi:predicted nuclease of predicted toxin-antitoxin system
VAHPYRNPIVGWMDDLKNMTAADALAWYERWYAPNNATMVVTGDVDANNFNTTSDKKLKTNLVRIENALDKIEKLNGYTFDWLEEYSEDRTRQIGMVADEVYEVQPELISHRNIVLSNKEEKIKLLDYSKVTAILIEAIKELNDKVTKLENKKKKK